MKVSILIATYNRPKRLARALESIKNQACQDYEVILVNDAGCDVSKVILDSGLPACVTLFNNDQNIGPTKSFQKALDNATGDLVIQLDDDDEIREYGILQAVDYFCKMPSIEALFCYAVRIKSMVEIEVYPERNFDYSKENVLKRNWCVNSARIVKRSVLEKIGFDKSLKVLVDWDINLNLFFNYSYDFPGYVVSKVHMSSDSWHQSHKELAAKEAEIIRKKYE